MGKLKMTQTRQILAELDGTSSDSPSLRLPPPTLWLPRFLAEWTKSFGARRSERKHGRQGLTMSGGEGESEGSVFDFLLFFPHQCECKGRGSESRLNERRDVFDLSGRVAAQGGRGSFFSASPFFHSTSPSSSSLLHLLTHLLFLWPGSRRGDEGRQLSESIVTSLPLCPSSLVLDIRRRFKHGNLMNNGSNLRPFFFCAARVQAGAGVLLMRSAPLIRPTPKC